MPIQVLNEDTINKIAAGEVVERPAGVVKELVENAIDAGATAISVEIREGGKKLIRVTDNGCGIPAGEVATAFLRHATSKIGSAEDLTNLHTLGFRGEALSSIAAVSRVEMITKTRDALVGVQVLGEGRLRSDDEAELSIREVGAPDGTSVMVHDLFFNVPVRLKFLRSNAAEAASVSELMEQLALSHPEISFHYRIDGKDRLHTTGGGKLNELIYRLFGREISGRILELKAEGERGIQMHGYIGRPELSRGTRAYEYFFVNGRLLRSDVLSRALERGYGTNLMQHQFPFAVLYLTMDPGEADVNIHPSKREVRFSEADEIGRFVEEAVQSCLRSAELIPASDLRTASEQKKDAVAEQEALLSGSHTEPFEASKTRGYAPKTDGYSVRENGPGAPQSLREKDPVYGDRPAAPKPMENADSLVDFGRFDPEASSPKAEDPAEALPGFREPTPAPSPAEADRTADPADGIPDVPAALRALMEAGEIHQEEIFHADSLANARLIGQVFGTYWIAEIGDKLLLIDQHAAHEKVNYEHFMAQILAPGPVPSQTLMPAEVIELSARESACIAQYGSYFADLGFELEAFDELSFTIRAVPYELFGNSPKTLLRDIIDELLELRLQGDPADIRTRIATMACKASVKGGQRLTEAEAKALVQEMLTLEDPYHCPHGRPTMITLTRQDLDKRFKRIVS